MNRFSILDRSLVIAGDRGIQLKDSFNQVHSIDCVFDDNDIEVKAKPRHQTIKIQTNKTELTLNTSVVKNLGVDKTWKVIANADTYLITDILKDSFDTTVLVLTNNQGNEIPY